MHSRQTTVCCFTHVSNPLGRHGHQVLNVRWTVPPAWLSQQSVDDVECRCCVVCTVVVRPLLIERCVGLREGSERPCGSQPCEARISCSSCFYWLRQIRRIQRSLDAESAKTFACIPSSNHVLTVAIPCWPGRQEPSLTGYNVC